MSLEHILIKEDQKTCWKCGHFQKDTDFCDVIGGLKKRINKELNFNLLPPYCLLLPEVLLSSSQARALFQPEQ